MIVLGALATRLVIAVDPVGQGLGQLGGGHVAAQQVLQLAFGTLGILAHQAVDVETGVQVADAQGRRTAVERIRQRLATQRLPEQRAGTPAGVLQGLLGKGQPGPLPAVACHPSSRYLCQRAASQHGGCFRHMAKALPVTFAS
ncbi:hypothetical protein D3C77_590450 [compost metagenome]